MKHQDSLNQAFTLLTQGSPTEALRAIQPVIDNLDNSHAHGTCCSDRLSVYYDFADSIQGFLFLSQSGEQRGVKSATLPFARAYSLAGQCFAALGQHQEAFNQLKKAVEWDPSSPSLRFLLAEACQALGDQTSHLACLESAFPLITTREDLARYLSYRGIALIKQGQIDRGVANLRISSRWYPLDVAKRALVQLADSQGVGKIRMDEATATDVMVAAGDAFLPQKETSQALVDLATQSVSQGNYGIALEALNRILAFVKDQEIEAFVADIEKMQAQQG